VEVVLLKPSSSGAEMAMQHVVLKERMILLTVSE
jgi:hypothetical protein